MNFSMLPQSVGLEKLAQHSFSTINVQGRDFSLHSFVKYVLNTGLSWDTCKPIGFIFSMVLDKTKQYIVNPVWMTLTSIQGHWVMVKLELVLSVERLHEATQMFMIVVLWRWLGRSSVSMANAFALLDGFWFVLFVCVLIFPYSLEWQSNFSQRQFGQTKVTRHCTQLLLVRSETD